MAAVDRDERAAVRNVAFNRDWWLRWLRPLAAASAVCVAGAVGWLGWEIRARKDLARNVQEVSAWVGGAPGVEVLRDFEAIRAFEAGDRTAGDVALMQAIVE
jgi:hypothetical protein